MSRKEELFKMVRLLHSQADAMGSRDAKQAFRKMADHYQREAEHLQGRPVPEIFNQNKQANSTKSAA
jgi:hypothetical protein